MAASQVAVRREPNTKSEALRQLPQGERPGSRDWEDVDDVFFGKTIDDNQLRFDIIGGCLITI